ncbi:MAG: hypothetical protein WAL32_08830 [Terriglobales bacterium]
MSVSGIASTALSQLGAGPMMQPTRRQSEDQIGRQLEQDLQNGDLTGAQQAYYQLAAFGPNNSGPFAAGTQMSTEFQQLGQDLQAGNLSAAQQDNTTITTNLLQQDEKAVQQSQDNANQQGLGNALANLKGDYWAIYGQMPNSSQLQALENGGGTSVSVQA